METLTRIWMMRSLTSRTSDFNNINMYRTTLTDTFLTQSDKYVSFFIRLIRIKYILT